MKIWGDRALGNPLRVAVFLEEKGIDVPFEPVDLIGGAQRRPEFLARNPAGQVPVLELDDGTCISETVAICRYFERLHPEPPLMGRNPLEEVIIEMWQRRVEWSFYDPVRAVLRHSVPALKAIQPVQIAEWAELNRPRIFQALEMFEAQLANHRFLAGPDFTIADITAILPLQMLRIMEFEVPASYPSVTRWRKDLLTRPSVTAVIGEPNS